jgi:hypothetical protein
MESARGIARFQLRLYLRMPPVPDRRERLLRRLTHNVVVRAVATLRSGPGIERFMLPAYAFVFDAAGWHAYMIMRPAGLEN